MGQGMRVTVDAAMRARDISRIRPQDEAPAPVEEAPPAPQAAPPPTRGRRGEKRRLAKRRAAKA
jgi:hypothetical protein